jgi:hypothetical protein
LYEQLSAQLSRPNQITFTKVNVDTQKEIAANNNVTAYVLTFSVPVHLHSAAVNLGAGDINAN